MFCTVARGEDAASRAGKDERENYICSKKGRTRPAGKLNGIHESANPPTSDYWCCPNQESLCARLRVGGKTPWAHCYASRYMVGSTAVRARTHVRTYVYTHVYTNVVHVYPRTEIHVRRCAGMNVSMHGRMRDRTHEHTREHMHAHAPAHPCMCARTHAACAPGPRLLRTVVSLRTSKS